MFRASFVVVVSSDVGSGELGRMGESGDFSGVNWISGLLWSAGGSIKSSSGPYKGSGKVLSVMLSVSSKWVSRDLLENIYEGSGSAQRSLLRSLLFLFLLLLELLLLLLLLLLGRLCVRWLSASGVCGVEGGGVGVGADRMSALRLSRRLQLGRKRSASLLHSVDERSMALWLLELSEKTAFTAQSQVGRGGGRVHSKY